MMEEYLSDELFEPRKILRQMAAIAPEIRLRTNRRKPLPRRKARLPSMCWAWRSNLPRLFSNQKDEKNYV